MRRSSTIIIASAFCGGAALVALADETGAPMQPTLTTVTDHRAVVVAGEDEGNFGFNRTGLTLAYDLALGDGFQFASFVDDEFKFVAVDSEGTDLTDLGETEFGTPPIVEPIMTFEDERTVVKEFKVNLASPARTATTFTVSGTIPANIFASTETIELEIPTLPAEMPESILGPGVQASMSMMGGNASVIFTPGSLKDVIEEVSLVMPGDAVKETTSSMWNEASVSYFFDGAAPEGTYVRLKIRRGFQTVPLRVTIVEMPLP